jgi:hypothetical protein
MKGERLKASITKFRLHQATGSSQHVIIEYNTTFGRSRQLGFTSLLTSKSLHKTGWKFVLASAVETLKYRTLQLFNDVVLCICLSIVFHIE